MRFTLSYEGELFATQNDLRPGQPDKKANRKQAIRKMFHRQLRELWRVDPMLSKYVLIRGDDTSASSYATGTDDGGLWGLGEPAWQIIADKFMSDGYQYVPLVTHASRLLCSLDVSILRRDQTASIFSEAGDIDNRIKTLIDCLRKPRDARELGDANVSPGDGESPFFCLLEDDNLVTGFSVKTDRLLDIDQCPGSNLAVKAVIVVTLSPYDPGSDNIMFA